MSVSWPEPTHGPRSASSSSCHKIARLISSDIHGILTLPLEVDMSPKLPYFLAATWISLLFAPLSLAQSTFGSITGIVTDPSGGVVCRTHPTRNPPPSDTYP